MKIAVLGPLFADSFARNICITLEAMGHEVWNHPATRLRHNKNRWHAAFWTNAPKLLPALNRGVAHQIVAGLAAFRPDLALSTHDFFDPGVIEQIKSAVHAPVFCWFIDPLTNLGNGRLFAAPYDRFFFKEPRLVEIFGDKLGKDARYLPEACNPMWHYPHAITPEQIARYRCDVATQGTLHYYRASFFELFAGSGLGIKIWGSNAPPYIKLRSREFFTGAFIGEHEKAIAFRSAKIVVDAMNYGEVFGVNQTLFEAAGSGAFVICDEKPALADLFRPGEEVVTFRNRTELLEKVRYYLSPQGEPDRLKIREAAAVRAHADHTFQHRLQTILAGIA